MSVETDGKGSGTGQEGKGGEFMSVMKHLKGAGHSRTFMKNAGQVKGLFLLALLVLAGNFAQVQSAYAGRESALLTSVADRGIDRHLVSRLAGHLGDDRIVTAGLGIKTIEVSSFILRSYDAHTGSLIAEDEFELTVDEESAAAIEAGAGRVYAVGSGLNPDGTLSLLVRAYEAGTGELLWEDELNPDPSAEREGTAFRTNGPRAFAKDTTDSQVPHVSQSSFRVQAVNTRTGEIVWQDEFLTRDQGDQDLSRRVPSGPPQVFERSFSILIQTYDTETGELLWQDQFYPTDIMGTVTQGGETPDSVTPEEKTALSSPAPRT